VISTVDTKDSRRLTFRASACDQVVTGHGKLCPSSHQRSYYMRKLVIGLYFLPLLAHAQTNIGSTNCESAGNLMFTSNTFSTNYRTYVANKFQELEASTKKSGKKSLTELDTKSSPEQLAHKLGYFGTTQEFCHGTETIESTLTAAYENMTSLWQH
jgi:hypothetical protein